MIAPSESFGDVREWPDLVGHRVLVKPVLSPGPLSSVVIESAGVWVALCGLAPHDKTLGWVPAQSVELLADLGCVIETLKV